MRSLNRRSERLAGALALAGLGVGASGCTLVADLDIEQCTRDSECAKYGEPYKDYICEEQLCQPFTCAADDECQARGGAYANFICESELCVVPECTEDVQCQGDGNTSATCTQGRCVDEKWGCLYDDVPAPRASPTIRFSAKVTTFNATTPPNNLAVVVCDAADADCSTPLEGPRVEVAADGQVNITLYDVKAAGFGGYFRFTGDNVVPLHYYFGTPLRRDVVLDTDAPIVMLFPGASSALGSSIGQEFDETTKALLTNRIFDCAGRPAEGLVIASEQAPDAIWYNSTDDYIPMLGKPTNEDGIGGLANIPKNIHTMNVMEAKSERVLFSYTLITEPAIFYLSFLYAADL